ncbi:putative O-glycosylation ligase, exosortase A system-associated [Rhodoferax koreense]|uniref:Putative O-glycosylation ligase, exosortase A system-associated n=1 Tax=Rhodoferax koreensis TaxID=1842727 RepID=A0A1P8K0F4_9BURK|nr:putative O-glycosylation ligase, exosortase A system-associated [Rhodoferax koreense]APW39490.1 putative O-glycosylation ligase, exosortase A system-associated [Rhodoferax koreense]
MRDLLLGGVIFSLICCAFARPWIGALTWTWISIMNPHSYSWVLSSMPVAAAVALSTLVGILVSKDRKVYFVSRETAMLMLFMLWVTITLPMGFMVEYSITPWKTVVKIDFMILVALVVLHSRQHIMGLAWVLAGSIGFYGFKGGLFTIATGGSYRVWGPDGTFIEGNNEIALALVIVIPLIRFLQMQVESRWVKHALTAVMILCAVASLGSQSRGALLALGAMGFVMWWRSESKAAVGVLMVVIGLVLIGFMPDSWMNRMETIGEYQEDGSAMGRINAWQMAWNLASHNFFGGSFGIYNLETFGRYAPDPTDVHAAHSIYFQVLGEHGFLGLFIFLVMWSFVWGTAGRMRKQGLKQPETRWVSDLGSMCQVSMAGYAVGGAFLSLAYFDLPYNILILVVAGSRWMDQKAWIREAAEQAVQAAGSKKKRRFWIFGKPAR